MARRVGMPFSDALVRALLAGHKTQTRRLKDNYRVGDIVHLREAWRIGAYPDEHGLEFGYQFRADLAHEKMPQEWRAWPDTIANEAERVASKWMLSWRPPRFMFTALARPERWEVVERRVEQLQDISEEDAKAEGSWTRPGFKDVWEDSYRHAFRQAWDEINGPTSWNQNPTVYAYTLRRVTV